MLHCSRKTRLALEAVLDVAVHSRQGPVQSGEITDRLNVPKRYMEQVMQHLVRHRVLKGVRGPRGGYVLATERRKITVGALVRVLDILERADTPMANAGSALGAAMFDPLWEQAQSAALKHLDSVTMDELCARATEAGLDKAGLDKAGLDQRDPANADFTI